MKSYLAIMPLLLVACASSPPFSLDKYSDVELLSHLNKGAPGGINMSLSVDDIVFIFMHGWENKGYPSCIKIKGILASDELVERLNRDGHAIVSCSHEKVSHVHFVNFREPFPNVFYFDYSYYTGPLAAASLRCHIEVDHANNRAGSKCTTLWIS